LDRDGPIAIVHRAIAPGRRGLPSSLCETLLGANLRKAEDTICLHQDRAKLNDLASGRHLEKLAVASAIRSVQTTTRHFMETPTGERLISL
jgi:hypothetical protein